MNARFILVCGALLVFANVAFGDGVYQRTKDNKTMVWNNDPKLGDVATWSGDRDREGYARGFGTLTWYTAQQKSETGSAKSELYARYWGNMVRGKFNGPVNVHSKGKTDYAIFADGVRTTRWAAGPAPYRAGAQRRAAVAKQNAAAEPQAPAEGPPTARTVAKKREEPVRPQFKTEAATPAEGPSLRAGPAADVNRPADRAVPKPATNKKSQAEVEESLRSLVGPPPALHTTPVADASPAGANLEAAASPGSNARLTKQEVIDAADAEARARGYNPAEYQRAEPQYNPADEIWSLSYEQKPVDVDGTAEIEKHFSVTIDDKTKGTVFVPGK